MSRYRNLTRFEYNTCNTIDDVTGAIEKLSHTHRRWDGIRCTELNLEPRQPQDFAVFPRPVRVYPEARADIAMPVPTPYNPNNGWTV